MDATDKPLGRLAVDAAKILRGKHKAIFTPHVDTGDHVIIINAEKVVMTGGNKGTENGLPSYRLAGRAEERFSASRNWTRGRKRRSGASCAA